MLTNHVSCHYVVTSVTFYHSALVDLTYSRSVHAVEHDPCCPDPTQLSASECKAVHYGLCSPLLKLPSFSIPPTTVSNPASPATPKGTSSPLTPTTPNSPVSSKGGGPSISELLGVSNRNPSTTVGSPVLNRPASPVVSVPVNQSSPNVVQSKMASPGAVVTPSSTNSSNMELGILDPVTLLASDLEDQLEALVNSFVAQDKVRLAARKNAELATTTGKSSLATNIGVSPIKKFDKKIKEDLSSDDESISSLSNENVSKSNGLGKKSIKTAKIGKVPVDPRVGDSNIIPPEITQDRYLFDNQPVNKPHSPFANFEENLYERASSPAFTVLPSLNPSLEYQQTGVKAQITKFASKEKDALQNSPSNSLERRQSPKPKPISPDSFLPQTGPQRTGPLMLDALQQLLLNSSGDPSTQLIQTTIFESSKLKSVPYTGSSMVNNIPPKESPVVKPFSKTDNYPACYVNEACKDFEDAALQFAKSEDNHGQNFHSAVDYAKTRFQNVQLTSNKSEDAKPKPIKNGHLVSDAKTKWENLPQQGWNDSQLVATDSIGDPLRDVLQTGGHKRTLSMEGLLDVPSIPHPKLTTAQKQHIKERSLSPTDRHSHVPIRPFLTKGSVAERVLLFECAPEKLERTTVVNKAKQNLIGTWRPGGGDVQIKTQVSKFFLSLTDLDLKIVLRIQFS